MSFWIYILRCADNSYYTGRTEVKSKIVKVLLIFTPLMFLTIDIAAWWLTKMHPGFAWLVMIGGVGYGLTSAVMIFSSLHQVYVKLFLTKRSLTLMAAIQ